MTPKRRLFNARASSIVAVIVVGIILRICLKLFQQLTGIDGASFSRLVFVVLYMFAVIFVICLHLILTTGSRWNLNNRFKSDGRND